MSVMYFLIPISMCVATIFLIAFFKAVKKGQFDDMYTPSIRILFDDEVKIKEQSKTTKINKTTKK